MTSRCNVCGELITAENSGQFFPEDDTYLCGTCRKEQQKSLEKMKNHAHQRSTPHLLATKA